MHVGKLKILPSDMDLKIRVSAWPTEGFFAFATKPLTGDFALISSLKYFFQAVCFHLKNFVFQF